MTRPGAGPGPRSLDEAGVGARAGGATRSSLAALAPNRTTPARSIEVAHLSLRDFRNHAEGEIDFVPGLTVITGTNGQGKTNVLEAVGYAATTRSFRGAAPEALIRDGADAAVVRVAGSRADRSFLIEAELPVTGRGRVQLNHQRVVRSRDLFDALLVSVFTPDDLALIKGGPIERRRHLDETMVALHPRHDAVRSDVERILRQKSALLKQARGARTADVQTTLDVWNTKLVEAGEQLAAAREEVLGLLGPVVTTAYHQIAGASPTTEVILTYDSAWRSEGLAATLDRLQLDELRRGVCLVGPQRDDVAVSLGGTSARTHASQGEQRSLALALRLGAHRLITDVVGVAPVLLLDDIFSELDPERSAALLAHLPLGQAILTTAGPLPAGARPARTLRVEAGAVREVP